MSTLSIVLLSILGAVLVLPWIAEVLYILSLRSSAKKTERFLCHSLRYIVYITGQVRSGKTTFMAGYANIRTKWLIKKATWKIRFTALAFPSVPFDAVQERLKEAFSRGEIVPIRWQRDCSPEGRFWANTAISDTITTLLPIPSPSFRCWLITSMLNGR